MNTDEQILQDAWYGRETTADSGINEEEQGDDAPEASEEVDETEEVQEDQSDEDGEDSEPEQPKEVSKKSWVPKLVAQRNEARREVQELRKQLAEANKAKLAEKYEADYLDDISWLSEQNAMSIYKQWRFLESKGLDIDEVEDVMAMSKQLNVPIERALTFYLAENKPNALVDPQTVAKSEAKKLWVTGIGRKVVTSKDEFSSDKMSEMDKLYKEQYIR